MEELLVHAFGRPDKPPMVLVHGLTEAGTTWPDAVRRWGNDWSIHALDQRGHGGSPRFAPHELTHSHTIWEDDLRRHLRRVGSPAVLVGHSLGGLMSLRVAAAHPELVRALVLEDPARPTGHFVGDPVFVAEQEAFLALFADGGAGESARMRRESSWLPGEIDAWAQCKPLVDLGMVRGGLHLGSGAWAEVFEQLAMPTLVIGPRGGEMLPRGVTNPLVTVLELDGVGHCVRRDDPDSFHRVVDAFLAQGV